MAMKVICPGCSAKLKVPEALAGKKVRCVRCRQAVSVPAQDLPWGELDEGDSVHDAIPASPTPVPAKKAVPPAPPAIPVAKFVPTRRPAPTPPAAPAVPVAPALPVAPPGDGFDAGNPFAFDTGPAAAPLVPRGKKGAKAAAAPAEEGPSPRKRYAKDSGQGTVKLAIGFGAAALVALGVGVGVFIYNNAKRPEPAAQKPEKPAEPAPTSAPAAQPAAAVPASSVADSATTSAPPARAAARPTGRGAARTAQTSGRGKPATTAPARAAPIDPDAPPDPGDGKPIPVPLGGGSPKKDEMKKDAAPAKPEGGKGKDEKPKE